MDTNEQQRQKAVIDIEEEYDDESDERTLWYDILIEDNPPREGTTWSATPICRCHSEEDAVKICDAWNGKAALEQERDAYKADAEKMWNCIAGVSKAMKDFPMWLGSAGMLDELLSSLSHPYES